MQSLFFILLTIVVIGILAKKSADRNKLTDDDDGYLLDSEDGVNYDRSNIHNVGEPNFNVPHGEEKDII